MQGKARMMVETFLRQADAALPAGYQAVLYGSAARGDWVEGMSDLNLLLIASPLGAAELRAIGPALREASESWRTPPLFLTHEEWSRAADVFAVELTDMQCAREVVRGEDPLAGVQPHPTLLRAAIERELRTRVIRLRQGYSLAAQDPAVLGELARGSLSQAQTLARATLVLVGRPVPSEGGPLLRAFAEVTGAPPGPLVEVATRWREAAWRCPPELFESFVQSLAVAVAYIDQHVPGVR